MSDFENVTAPPPPPGDAPGADEKQLAMFAHLSALTGIVTCGLGTILGPLIFWLIFKDKPERAFVTDQAKETLNFVISLILVNVVLWVLGNIPILGFVFWLLSVVVGIAALVLIIMAAIKANGGEAYRYPFALRLIK